MTVKKTIIVRNVTPSSLVDWYQSPGETSCLHIQGIWGRPFLQNASTYLGNSKWLKSQKWLLTWKPGFDSRQGRDYSLCHQYDQTSSAAHPNQKARRGFSPWVQSGRKVKLPTELYISSAKVSNAWNFIFTSPLRLHVALLRYRRNI
jgi:hypothetical protein